MPNEIKVLLGSHPQLREIVIDRVLPEHQIRFDALRGEPRNADLAIAAHDVNGPLAITVEGKADESFDRPVRAVLDAALDRIAADKATGAVERVQALSAALLPPWREGLPHLGELRYQLLTGIAGTVAWAHELGATRAVFIVHEFVTDSTDDRNHSRNMADLNSFLCRLSSDPASKVPTGVVVGPFGIPGGDVLPSSVELFVGKAVRHLRSTA